MYESYSSSGRSAERLRPPACWAAALGALAVACFLTACSSSKFDPAMMKANRAVPLDKAWAACQQVLGAYRSHGTPTFVRKDQFDLEQVPATMADWPSMVTITYNPNGTIAGFHCGVPPS